MNFNSLNTYNDSYEKVFEAFCNQLFERWLPREYPGRVRYFTTVNGAGGDGGVEAYGVLDSNEVVGVQAKWFRSSLDNSQIRQIRDSIQSAKTVRPQLKRYIVCLPRDFQSIKIGRGKVITTDCEEKRINALIDDIFTIYPDLELEFWNEHRIREELQHPGAENIRRFWFEKEELSVDYLKQRFSLAKAGWLKERYVSSLHSQGKIHQTVEEVLFTPAYRKKESAAVLKVIKETRLTCELIDSFNELAGGGNEFESDLVAIRENLEQFLVPLEQVYQAITHGDDALEVQVPEEVNIWPTRLRIANAKLPNRFKNVQPRLVSALEKAHQTHIGQYISQVLAYDHPHNNVVLGQPGTGKTHGVAEAVEDRLASGMPALIIRAKGTPCANWATILHSTLGGLNHWSDVEIWSGLEALAVRADAYRALSFTAADDIQNETTRVLICIDGIDEAADIGAWRIRINELREWIKMFPRLRFVVTSRSYPPANQNPCDIDLDEEVNRRFDLPEDGDVPLSELVPKYLTTYEIEFKDTPWIVDSFENALSLKLFCEQYHGQDLAKQSKPVHVGLTALLNAKIQRLEDEFFDKHGKVWSAKDQVLRRALFPLADALQHTPSCDHDSLCDHLITKLKGLIDRRWAAELLEAFSDHGFLWRGEKTPEDGISPTMIYYTITYQSYIDYFISIRATQEALRAGKALPSTLQSVNDWNIYRITAISLLSDYSILVGEDGYWVDDLDQSDLQDLQFEALRNAPSVTIKKYLDKIKERFLESAEQRNATLKYFILPNLHRRDLALGVEFLHKTLIAFPNTFQRDLVWSGPDKYSRIQASNIGQVLGAVHLRGAHIHSELPLVLAWSLSTVNNTYREGCRKELTEWASDNILEFIKLLELVFFCGDPQIQEDLAIVMLGVVALTNKPGSGLDQLASWVKQRIFSPTEITKIKNAVVRHCARAIMERAHDLGECTKEEVGLARPPYATHDQLLPLDLSGEWEGRGERYPIVHDLAWYVIDNSHEHFLDYRGVDKISPEGRKLLKRYSKKYKCPLTPHPFAVSAAIAFIKNLGWDRVDGPGMTEASHGSVSKLATFEEKYTWLAVHEIQGYLADLMPFDRGKFKRLPDYNLMLYILNPATDNLRRAVEQYSSSKAKWYIPYDIAPILEYTDATLQKAIKHWVNRKDLPVFESWLTIEGAHLNKAYEYKKWVPLYIDTDLAEPNNICRTALEMVCCLISKDSFSRFLDYFRANLSTLRWLHFNRLDSFGAGIQSQTYASVRDAVWMKWMGEDEAEIIIETGSDEPFTLRKTLTQVAEDSISAGEEYYRMPSKIVRNALQIVDTDKKRYFDASGNVVALHHKVGKPFYDSQKYLVIDSECFDKFVSEAALKPFWIAFQFQSTTPELKEHKAVHHSQNCRYWLVWEEDGEVKSFLFQDSYFANDK